MVENLSLSLSNTIKNNKVSMTTLMKDDNHSVMLTELLVWLTVEHPLAVLHLWRLRRHPWKQSRKIVIPTNKMATFLVTSQTKTLQ